MIGFLFSMLALFATTVKEIYSVYQEQENAKSEGPLTVKEREERARQIVESRILSQEEFKQIQQRQLSKHFDSDQKSGGNRKRSRPENDLDRAALEYVFHF